MKLICLSDIQAFSLSFNFDKATSLFTFISFIEEDIIVMVLA